MHRTAGALIALDLDTVAEPLPEGVWIRPAQERPATAVYRRWLHSSLADRLGRPGRFRVVIGYPDCPAVPSAAVIEYCDMIPAAVWPGVRFSRFGPVSRPARPHTGADPFGQTLADLLGRFVIAGTGVRICGPAEPGGARERVLLPDGVMSWLPYATDFGFTPRGLGFDAASKPASDLVPIDAAAPVPGLVETRPGTYALDDGVVLEVIQNGLWVRPDQPPANAAVIRGSHVAPLQANLVYDTSSSSPATAKRMRSLAADVLQRLAEGTRAAFRLLPAHSLAQEQLTVGARQWAGPIAAAVGTPPEAAVEPPLPETAESPVPTHAEPAAELPRSPLFRLESAMPSTFPSEGRTPTAARPEAHTFASDPVPGDTAEPAEPAAPAAPAAGKAQQPSNSPRAQCAPAPAACALPPGRCLDEERTWLRRSLADRYDAEAGLITRLLSETPGLRGGAGETAEQVVTDLVAVRLYLAGDSRALDDAVRAATVGPHVPMARCVASGLRRLPSYRGATRLRADLSPDELHWYADRRTVTEWSFCPALAGGQGRLPGAAEVLIWSVTARRTALVDPDLPEQVVFLPGTRFSVLLVEDTARPGLPPRLLLREQAATEPDAADGLSALDELALRGLDQAAGAWRESGGAQRPQPPAAAAGRFGNPPGLILNRPAPARKGPNP